MKDKIAFLISLLLLLPVLRAQEEISAQPYFDVNSVETALTEPDRERAASLATRLAVVPLSAAPSPHAPSPC